MKSHIFALILLIAFALPLAAPYILPGYPQTDDGTWAVIRTAEMHREVRDLQFPPRWSSFLNHGYGYPLFLYTYQLPFVLSEAFHLLGFGVIVATKLVFIVSIFGSALAMYLLGASLWGKIGGFASALLYMYAPYRLINLYARGSIGESLAFVFLPLLFWVTRQLVATRKMVYLVLMGGILALFMITHNATSVLFLPFLLIWCGSLIWMGSNKKQSMTLLCLGLVLGLSLSAYFWLPALMEKQFIALAIKPLAQKSEHILQLSDIFGYTVNNSHFPYRLSPVLFIAALAGIAAGIRRKQTHVLSLVLGTSLLLGIFLLTRQSLMLWKMPLLREIDFPWRLLTVISFLASLLAGIVGRLRKGILIAAVLTISMVFSAQLYVRYEPRSYESDTYFETNDATTTSADELEPVWITDPPQRRWSSRIEGAETTIDTTTQISGTVNSDVPKDMVVQALYFPGWTLYLDGVKSELGKTKETGLMTFPIGAGTTKFDIIFERTSVRLIADVISGASLIIYIGLWIFLKRISFSS